MKTILLKSVISKYVIRLFIISPTGNSNVIVALYVLLLINSIVISNVTVACNCSFVNPVPANNVL